jgi:hypothetical protein
MALILPIDRKILTSIHEFSLIEKRKQCVHAKGENCLKEL